MDDHPKLSSIFREDYKTILITKIEEYKLFKKTFKKYSFVKIIIVCLRILMNWNLIIYYWKKSIYYRIKVYKINSILKSY